MPGTLAFLGVVLAVAVGSWCGTWAVRRYALTRAILDVPNERSSHSAPTPRGGGLAIVATFLAAVVFSTLLGWINLSLAVVLVGGGGVVALIGLIDDLRHVPVHWRLTVHVFASAVAVVWAGRFPPVDFGVGSVDLGFIGTLLTLLFLAWWLNLFNFMDGIDGIAIINAATIAGCGAFLSWKLGQQEIVVPACLLMAAAAGFAAWNWPPAKIFMGDVGSGFLGYSLGALAAISVARGDLNVWVWLILFGVFLADATVTLFRRALRGERLHEAHRSHAYQRLSRHWKSHRPVTLVVLSANMVWLLPLAWVAAMEPQRGLAVTLLAWAPLFGGAWALGAGTPGEIRQRV